MDAVLRLGPDNQGSNDYTIFVTRYGSFALNVRGLNGVDLDVRRLPATEPLSLMASRETTLRTT